MLLWLNHAYLAAEFIVFSQPRQCSRTVSWWRNRLPQISSGSFCSPERHLLCPQDGGQSKHCTGPALFLTLLVPGQFSQCAYGVPSTHIKRSVLPSSLLGTTTTATCRCRPLQHCAKVVQYLREAAAASKPSSCSPDRECCSV